jgi:hypothetical protein
VYDFLKYLDHEYPEFQYEALWCLTNIASSSNHDYSYSIINKEGIPKIIAKIDSNIQEIQEQVNKFLTEGNLGTWKYCWRISESERQSNCTWRTR